MAFSSYLRALRSLRSTSRLPSSRRPSRRRPTVETLEDRCVPSTLAVVNADDNVAEHGTLRWAVANAISGDEIQITAALKNTPIVLTQGELLLNHSVTIEGVGNVAETVSGGGTSRIFEVAAGANVTLDNLTLTGGNGFANNPAGTIAVDGYGGAIFTFSGSTLTLSACTISGNTTAFYGYGGGIFNDGTLTVIGSTFSGNSAGLLGGGIFTNSTLSYGATFYASGCTFSGNSGIVGGGIYSNGGTATLVDCTLSDNLGFDASGGAIFSDGMLTVTDCTLTNNTGSAAGGAINNFGTAMVSGCTFTGNTAGVFGGAISNSGTLTVSGCTFTGNSAAIGGAISNFGTLTVSGSAFSANTPDNIFNALGSTYIDGGGNTFS